MVRFGAHLEASKLPDWEDSYVDYLGLRDASKNSSTDPEMFAEKWYAELGKCEDHVTKVLKDSTIKLLKLRDTNELACKLGTQLPGLCKETNRGFTFGNKFVGHMLADPDYWSSHPTSRVDAEQLHELILPLFERQHHFCLVNTEALRKLASKVRKYVDTEKAVELECALSISLLANSSSIEFYHKIREVVFECLRGSDFSDTEDSLEEVGSPESVPEQRITKRNSFRAGKSKVKSEFDALCQLVQSFTPEVLKHLVAHRGFHSRNDVLSRPLENTIPAYEQAWASGLHYCECDVTLTLDGQVVLSHDHDLRRLARHPLSSSAEVPVSKMTYAQLYSLPLKNGTHAPLLSEVLNSAIRTGPHASLVVEIKPGTDGAEVAVALCNMFREHPKLLKRVAVVMSFDLFIIHNFNKFFQAEFATADPTKEYYAPKVMFLTQNDNPLTRGNGAVSLEWGHKEPEEVLDSIHGYLEQGGSRLDGIYMQMHEDMFEEGSPTARAIKSLSEEYMVGIWGSRKQPDTLERVEVLNSIGASFVNTDLTEGFDYHNSKSEKLKRPDSA
mmetsp:Transcript_20449/g.38030  ORF Transcript_20449/g.38030 Transcript_20449/m.38030 type:complete len:557 (+) Transcript_20449:437-2107(+)|eukprot:CAMPEP_0184542732 /NCGR_PEP_ID=MMETSP0199_2-20130426/2354_1 /TAXON_ID=1112570 /ORGANISM="Thraustochytrium sp., Strain LLF1b" /LENGTH=556 /DNA_ID=CAMNT_0026936619 /DNA_START=343 /DNA_END=2013 /DNA_ORIENTATION=-